MTDTKKATRTRGRPRNFDIEASLDVAQRLFHQRGYEQVSVGELTEALGINPPSFYAAFGSKAELFDKVMARYAATALPLDDILRPGRSVREALADLLDTAAAIYARDSTQAGCLVLEAARSGTAEEKCTIAARTYRRQMRERIRDYMAREGVARPDVLADFIDITLSGMSASAREGWSSERLRAVAATAGLAITAAG